MLEKNENGPTVVVLPLCALTHVLVDGGSTMRSSHKVAHQHESRRFPDTGRASQCVKNARTIAGQPKARKKRGRPLQAVISHRRQSRLLWETLLLQGQSTNQCCTIQARPIVHDHGAYVH